MNLTSSFKEDFYNLCVYVQNEFKITFYQYAIFIKLIFQTMKKNLFTTLLFFLQEHESVSNKTVTHCKSG